MANGCLFTGGADGTGSGKDFDPSWPIEDVDELPEPPKPPEPVDPCFNDPDSELPECACYGEKASLPECQPCYLNPELPECQPCFIDPDLPECQPCAIDPDLPECQPCFIDPTLPECKPTCEDYPELAHCVCTDTDSCKCKEKDEPLTGCDPECCGGLMCLSQTQLLALALVTAALTII